jgi:alkylation response protein AidB-like acyl-CoA dehydrogenase
VNFGFTDEQEMLRASARRFLDSACAPTVVRRAMAHPTGDLPELWQALVELGWTGVVIPAVDGGLGGSIVDLVVILEETGRALLPAPFLSTASAATALVAGGSPAQRAAHLPRVAAGRLRLALAVAEEDGRFDPAGVTLPARRDGDRVVVNGEKYFVLDAHVADRLVVAARTGAGLTLCLVDRQAPGVTVTPLRTVDMTRRIARVSFERVRVPASDVVGTPGEAEPVLRRCVDVATVGLCAEMVGTAQEALDRTVAYVKERKQFGRPVGAFQAVKHRCVDMLVAVESGRSLAYWAAWAVDEGVPEARQAVAMAKAFCSDMVMRVTSEAIQLHGGIGFTWEHDAHLFHRRAVAQATAFGTATAHRAVVADVLAP